MSSCGARCEQRTKKWSISDVPACIVAAWESRDAALFNANRVGRFRGGPLEEPPKLLRFGFLQNQGSTSKKGAKKAMKYGVERDPKQRHENRANCRHPYLPNRQEPVSQLKGCGCCLLVTKKKVKELSIPKPLISFLFLSSLQNQLHLPLFFVDSLSIIKFLHHHLGLALRHLFPSPILRNSTVKTSIPTTQFVPTVDLFSYYSRSLQHHATPSQVHWLTTISTSYCQLTLLAYLNIINSYGKASPLLKSHVDDSCSPRRLPLRPQHVHCAATTGRG